MEPRRVPCARSSLPCSEPSKIFWCEAIPPSLLPSLQVVPKLVRATAASSLGCTMAWAWLGCLHPCLSQQPRSLPSLLPSWSRLLAPAGREQSCLSSRQPARTSYSHQARCQLCQLGRYSSSLHGDCRENGAGSFHVLLVVPLLSPVPPAEGLGALCLCWVLVKLCLKSWGQFWVLHDTEVLECI